MLHYVHTGILLLACGEVFFSFFGTYSIFSTYRLFTRNFSRA